MNWKNVQLEVQDADQVGWSATLASLLEISASPKPGNVHRFSTSKDYKMNYEQFLFSISAIAPVYMDLARDVREKLKRFQGDNESKDGGLSFHLGRYMKKALEQMIFAQSAGNLLLGHVLLFTPLTCAAVLSCEMSKLSLKDLKDVLVDVMHMGNYMDVVMMYDGIRACHPGGLGHTKEFDIMSPNYVDELRDKKATFIDVFSVNKNDDLISSEWVTGFDITFTKGFPFLFSLVNNGTWINDAIVQTFLYLLSNFPDSLIQRKAGLDKASEITSTAKKILEDGGIFTPEGKNEIIEFDKELKRSGGMLNPGTIADLTASSIFLLLLTGFRI
ncbi:MAG: triphosphoribosyl-dephospho-CoA synthase [Promethearchaeota archaeon]